MEEARAHNRSSPAPSETGRNRREEEDEEDEGGREEEERQDRHNQ